MCVIKLLANALRREVNFQKTLKSNMATLPKNILAMGGSLRQPSFTSNALTLACQGAAAHGANIWLFCASDLPTDIFDPRTAYQQPSPAASALIAAAKRADGFLWASPAYHGTISGQFKNSLDYLDLMRDSEPPLLSGKPVGIISVSSGRVAAINAANTMIYAAHALRAQPLPLLIQITDAKSCFDTEGRCKDSVLEDRLRLLGATVVRAIGGNASSLKSQG